MNPKRAEELIDAIDQIYRKYLSEYVDDAPPDKIEAYREEAAALLLVEMRKEREGEWERGYFCAVAKLILSEGLYSTTARELFRAGGDWKAADEEDKAVFIQYGAAILCDEEE